MTTRELPLELVVGSDHTEARSLFEERTTLSLLNEAASPCGRRLIMYIYSLAMRLVWQEESARVLLPLLRDIPTQTEAPPPRAMVGAALGAMQLQQTGLAYGDAILKYEQRWSMLQNPLLALQYPTSAESDPQEISTDPYRQLQPDRYRLIECFIAGEAELYSLGYFSVGASKPHNRAKLALLFQELRPLQPRTFWWRITPQPEREPFSKEEAALLGVSVVG